MLAIPAPVQACMACLQTWNSHTYLSNSGLSESTAYSSLKPMLAACAAEFEQCGGTDFDGLTNCCEGLSCTQSFRNETEDPFYQQCTQPGVPVGSALLELTMTRCCSHKPIDAAIVGTVPCSRATVPCSLWAPSGHDA